ncbi:MAG TPA: hypothetical protein VGD31_12595 [Sphingobacteriaceae bacterium]
MSLFGKMDAARIPSNPYFIEAGEYLAEVTEAKYQDRDGQRQLRIDYTISDETSLFHGKRVSHFFDLPDEDMTEEAFELLPAEEKTKIHKAMSSLKRTLCGTEGNDRQIGLGLNEDTLNDPDWNPESLKGTKLTLGISNWGKEGVNIKFVNTYQLGSGDGDE